MIPQEPRETITCRRVHAISHLFIDDPGYMNYVFNVDRSELSASPEKMARQADRLSGIDHQQALLVRVALDIWAGTKFTRISSLFAELHVSRLEKVVAALLFLNVVGGCACPRCKRRPTLSTTEEAARDTNH
jgi:hypothetical protein